MQRAGRLVRVARRVPFLLALGPGCIGMDTLQKWNREGARTGRVSGMMYRGAGEWEVTATVVQQCRTCSFEFSATFVSLDDPSLDFSGDLEFVVSDGYYSYYKVYGPRLDGGSTYWGGGAFYGDYGSYRWDWGDYYTTYYAEGNGTSGWLSGDLSTPEDQ